MNNILSFIFRSLGRLVRFIIEGTLEFLEANRRVIFSFCMKWILLPLTFLFLITNPQTRELMVVLTTAALFLWACAKAFAPAPKKKRTRRR